MRTAKPSKRQIRNLLTWVKRQIRAHPRKYNQGSFCGTPCCIAGWIDIRLNGEIAHQLREKHDFWGAASTIAAIANAALGVKEQPALFESYWSGYLHKATTAMQAARNARERAEAGCLAIDLYMKRRGI